MKSSKLTLFLIIIALVFIINLIGVWIATEWVAAMLGYQRQLGAPLLVVSHYPIYLPKFLSWWYRYYTYAPKQFDKASKLIYLCAVIGSFTSIYFARLWAKTKNVPTSHGSAHWATQENIKKAGLLNNQGVVLGINNHGHYLRHDGPEHIMLMAPTRTGKGTGVIIPTLLTWPHSILVTDIKGENWAKTAGYRQKFLGNKVLKFDPTAIDGSSVRYNPLDEIRLKTVNEVRDVQNVADMLVDPQGTGQLDHWAKTGHALLVGVSLHLKYIHPNATLTDVATFLSNPDKTFDETLIEMMRTKHDQNGLFTQIYRVENETHPIVAQAARELLNKSENERSGVLSTAMSFLGLYRDPIVAAITKVSEFSISDLMNYEQPVSLYLVPPPSDINRTMPLIRMILNQITRRLTEKMGFENGKPVTYYKHRLLLILDEFPAFGRLDTFESALAYIAGYGLKVLLIVQTLNQLYKTYTQYNSIMDNCHIRIIYTPNDEKTPEVISKLLGTKTEVVDTLSYQGRRLKLFNPKINTHQNQIARALLTPGEVSQLPENQEIILVAGLPPILAYKLKYYEDENFKDRLIYAPSKSDVIIEACDEPGNININPTINENEEYHSDLIESPDTEYPINLAEDIDIDFI